MTAWCLSPDKYSVANPWLYEGLISAVERLTNTTKHETSGRVRA